MYQKIIFVGRAGKDPKLTYLSSGDPVVNFSVAVSRKYTKNGQKVEEVAWFNVSQFGKAAEAVSQYLKKGHKVLVEGRLTPVEGGGPRTFEDAGGKSRGAYDVNASQVVFLSDKSSEEGDDEQDDAGPGF